MLRALLLSCLVAGSALAQDRQATERRLTTLRSQIEGVERQVRQTRGKEMSELRALEGLDAEVQLRQELVSGYRGQIGTIRTETETLRRSIERLETEIQDAKQSYRERARHAYMHGRRNALALILAAGSVNQMIVRARYLQQFAGRRRSQVERIAQKTGEMRTREQAVRTSLEETQRLLQQSQAEQARIAESRRERAALVTDLRSQRGRLERELDQRRTDAQQLAGLVQNLVAEERARAAEERRRQEAAEAERQRQAAAAEAERIAEVQRRARDAERRAREVEDLRRRPEPRSAAPPPAATPAPPTASPPASSPASPPSASPPVAVAEPRPAAPKVRPAPAPRPTPAARPAPTPRAAPPVAESRSVDLTGSFRQNRGRLPRPADGAVTGRFGSRRDPVTNTTTSSPGIDISTAPGAPARAVFEGVVQRVGTIPTYGTYVMVSHGEYVTLYGNLSQVAVRQGQRVRAGETIGRAGTAAQRRGSQLFFALYQGGTAVDPTGWLR
ncbi:murein hydrolase activator EnvC family protein [Rubrivirga sp.]|uniref:murein hydrolase activator EnvC family protein n=1 Tax=Rubrivirga sp. TaxID=1885344 RepID=UPI003B52E6E9